MPLALNPVDALVRDQRRLRWALWALNIGVALLLALLAVASLSNSHEIYKERVREATDNLAVGQQVGIGAQLMQVDIGLRHFREELDRNQGHVHLQAMLAGQRALVPFVEEIGIASAGGAVSVVEGNLLPVGTDVSSLDFFLHARKAMHDRALLSEPLQIGAGERWVVALARRLTGSDGRFEGIVYALIPVDHFERTLRSADVGREGALSLRSASLGLVARHSAMPGSAPVPGSARVSAELGEALARDPAKGYYTAVTALDGIERANAYRRLHDFPMWVVAGLSTHEFYAPWRSRVAYVVGLMAALVAVLAAASVLGYRSWARARRSVQARVEEGERSRALLRTASDGIHVLDRDGRLVELSDSFARMLGYTRDELMGRHVWDWDVRGEDPAIRQWLRDFPPERNQRFEVRHRRRDGSLISVEVEARAAVFRDGTVLIYCSARDVTERNRLTRELAASAAQLKDLYDQAPCGYYSLDGEGLILRANATLRHWLGVPEHALVGRPIADFFTDEGRAQFVETFPTFKSSGQVEGIEFDLVPARGPRRRVRVAATALTDDLGPFRASRSMMMDITAQHEAELKAQALLCQQHAMLDNDLIGMTRLRKRRGVWVNRALERIFGYRHGELLGQSVRVLYADDAAYEALGAAAYPVLQAGGRYRAQVEMRRKDGDAVWIDLSGVMLSDDEALWMMVDITALKRHQQQVEHIAFHDPLTGLANRLLLADRLEQAISAAERAGRLVGVCYLDLDGFKQVNDTHGHAAGDALLKDVASRLGVAVRAVDTVARLGGDEFVVVLSGLESVEEGVAVAERVHGALSEPCELGGGRRAHVQASAGLVFYPLQGHRPGLLLSLADQAMFEAKRDGKNRLKVYGNEPESEPASEPVA